jgi:uncharacterized RDD family membrane protein YckC
MEQPSKESPKLGIRLLSMLIDHVSMSIVMGIPMVLLMILTMTHAMVQAVVQRQSQPPNVFPGMMNGMMIIFGIVFPIYLNKDIFRGRSLGKWILKMQVLNNKTGLAASPVRCVLRNVTQFIWPIEGLITLFSPGRRLGDLIAGTRIGLYDKDQEKKPVNRLNFVSAILIGIAIIACWIFLVLYPLSVWSAHLYPPKPALQFQF